MLPFVVGEDVITDSFPHSFFQNTVVVVSGETARQTFFTAKGLDLTEGFKILSGAVRLSSSHFILPPTDLDVARFPWYAGSRPTSRRGGYTLYTSVFPTSKGVCLCHRVSTLDLLVYFTINQNFLLQ